MNLIKAKPSPSIYQLIARNVSSLVGTAGLTYGFGFLFWWIAAKSFSQADVGLASTAISSMMLAANLGVLGIGTLLIGELSKSAENATTLISTGLIIVSLTSSVLSVIFAIVMSIVSNDIAEIVNTPLKLGIFVLGVVLIAVTLVIDQAAVGLLKGEVQLKRNAVFAFVRTILLILLGVLIVSRSSIHIIFVWTFGNFVSIYVIRELVQINPYGIVNTFTPQFSLIKRFRLLAVGHHALNMLIDLPNFVLPLIVTFLLSPTSTAAFYVAWMLSGFVVVIPAAMSNVLYAIGVKEKDKLSNKFLLSMTLSLVSAFAVALVLYVLADFVLQIFGSDYSYEAMWCLRFLVFGAVARIVRIHFVTLCRIKSTLLEAILLVLLSTVLQLTFATIGIMYGNLTGLGTGWWIAMSIEAGILLIAIWKSLKSNN